MTAISAAAANAVRDFVTAGVPASGDHEPLKSDVRALFAVVDAALASLGVNGAITVKYASRSLLYADLAHAANSLAVVYNDATAAFNGIYAKSGGSGSGAWAITALALPSSFAADLALALSQMESLDAAANVFAGVADILGEEDGVVVWEGGEWGAVPRTDFKGDPGGNAMAVGLFTALSSLTIPSGADLIQTSGYGAVGVGAARYAAVGAGPATAWREQTANGRWFELAEPEIKASHVGCVGYAHADAVRPDHIVSPYTVYFPNTAPTAETIAAAVEDDALQALFDAADDLKRPVRFDEGRAYRQSVSLTVGDDIEVRGTGASLTTTAAAIAQLAVGSSFRCSGLRICGPGAGYASGSTGVKAFGVENGDGVAPTRIIGPKLTDMTIRGVGDRAVDMRYVTGGLLSRSYLAGIGYTGLGVISGDDVWMEFCRVEHLTGNPSTQDAYGGIWTRWATVADLVRQPPSRGGGARFNWIGWVPTWHALDTHGGHGIHFLYNTIYNCRRGVIITADPFQSARNIVRIGNRCLNEYAVDDLNASGSEKRAEAFWVFGNSTSDRAINIVSRGNYAQGHGRSGGVTGSYYIQNVSGLDSDDEDVSSYQVGLSMYGGVDGRIRHRTANTRSVGVGAGAISDVPIGVLIAGNDYVLDMEDVRVIRDDLAGGAFVNELAVFYRTGTGRTIRRIGVNQRYEGVVPGFTLESTDAGLTGDMTRTVTLTSTGFASDPSPDVRATRAGSVAVLTLPAAVTGTSDATTFTLLTLPADMWPKETQTFPVGVEDAGVWGPGRVQISNAGVVTILNGAGGAGAFTASGTKSISPFTLTYALEIAP